MTQKVILILLVMASSTYGAVIECKTNIKLIPAFLAKETKGIWYAHVISGDAAYTVGDCLKHNVTGINNLVTRSFRFNGQYQSTNLTIVQEQNSSKYNSKTPGVAGAHYWVDTDYSSYAVYYYCVNGKGTVDLSTRDRYPNAETMAEAMNALWKSGLLTAESVVRTIPQCGCQN